MMVERKGERKEIERYRLNKEAKEFVKSDMAKSGDSNYSSYILRRLRGPKPEPEPGSGPAPEPEPIPASEVGA